MNLKSRLTLPLVLVVSCLFAASGPAAEVRLSATSDLQAEGNLAYTFEAGDTFVVDAAFSPTSFKPTCSGDFTMKVVEGGSVASSTTLDFSAVTGALTLSGLGTADSRLPAPTVASNKTVNLESCWFSGLTLTTASLKGVTYNVSGTGALGALSCLESSSTNTATLNLSGTQEITSIASPYRSGGTYLTVKVAADAEVTVTGEYDAGTSSLTIEGTMTCQRGFKTNRKSYQETHVYVNAGGTLAVTGDFKLGDGYNANAFLHVQGGTVTVSGTFIRNCSSQAKGTVGISSGLLRVGSLKDQNSGTGLPFGNGQSATTTNYLTGGTLEVLNGTWTSTAATFHTKGTTVKVGESTSMGIAWVLEADTPLVVPEGKSLTFANTITGEGGFILSENKGTVGLGTNRPTLKSVGGTIAVTPTTAEGIAGKVSLPVGEGVTSLEGVTIEVSAWSAYETTMSLGETAIEVTVVNPKRTLAGNGTWSGTWENTESTPTSGSAEVVATADGTLTIDQAVSLDTLIFDVGAGKTLTVALDTGASLTATQTVVRSGKVIVQGGTYGTVTLADNATLLFAGSGEKRSFGYFTAINPGGTAGVTVEKGQTLTLTCATGSTNSGKVYDGSRLLLRTGTLRKEGEGTATLQTYNVTEADNQSIEVAGGTLTIYEEGGLGSYGHPAHTFQNVAIDAGCTLASTAKWGTHIAVAGALRGEGAFTFSEATTKEKKPRNCELLGTFADFTGTLTCNATSLIFGAESTGDFGGSASVTRSTKYKEELFQIARTADLLVAGNLSLGSGVTLDLAAGGRLSVGGTFTVGGSVPVTLSAENVKIGEALITLTGEGAEASAETAALLVPSLSGTTIEAVGNTYVLAANPEATLTEDSTWSAASWQSNGAALGLVPTTGEAEVMATANATLSVDAALALDALTLAPEAAQTLTVALDAEAEGAGLQTAATTVTSGEVVAQTGSYGAVRVAEGAALLFGAEASFESLAAGGTIGVSGEGTWDATAAEALLFRSGTLRKVGEGVAELTLKATTGSFGDAIEVVGGTLKVNQSEHLDRTYASNISVAKEATFVHAATWASSVTFAGALSGEGAVELWDRTASGATRTATFTGACAGFTGTVTAQAVHTTLAPADKHFGGSLTLTSAGAGEPPVVLTLADGLVVDGDVSVTPTETAAVTLALAGAAPTAKSLTLARAVAVSLPEALIADGTVLFTLSGDAEATVETAALLTPPKEGYSVKAEGKAYVLRWNVSLPGVKPSEPGASDEAGYSTEAAAALTAAAEEARIAEVSQVLLQTKGAASGSEPTVTEVNNVLGCFEGVVEADSDSKTLTIRYEFGVADIGPNLDEEGAWNGKWYVVAKVEGPAAGAAAFAEGVIVSAYEVGGDGQIPDGATPLATETIAAGTPVSAVTLKGITLTGLGTHGVRVRVRAEQQ